LVVIKPFRLLLFTSHPRFQSLSSENEVGLSGLGRTREHDNLFHALVTREGTSTKHFILGSKGIFKERGRNTEIFNIVSYLSQRN